MRLVPLFLAILGMLLINGITGIAVWKSARSEKQRLPSVTENGDGKGDAIEKQQIIVSSPSQEVWGRRSRGVQKARDMATIAAVFPLVVGVVAYVAEIPQRETSKLCSVASRPRCTWASNEWSKNRGAARPAQAPMYRSDLFAPSCELGWFGCEQCEFAKHQIGERRPRR